MNVLDRIIQKDKEIVELHKTIRNLEYENQKLKHQIEGLKDDKINKHTSEKLHQAVQQEHIISNKYNKITIILTIIPWSIFLT